MFSQKFDLFEKYLFTYHTPIEKLIRVGLATHFDILFSQFSKFLGKIEKMPDTNVTNSLLDLPLNAANQIFEKLEPMDR